MTQGREHRLRGVNTVGSTPRRLLEYMYLYVADAPRVGDNLPLGCRPKPCCCKKLSP